MKYKARMEFNRIGDTDDGTFMGSNLTIAKMQVTGGTSRIINFNSTDDISLTSELEQARTYKNIVLYLDTTKHGNDMLSVVDLMSLNKEMRDIEVVVTIHKHDNQKIIEGFHLIEENASLVSPPVRAFEDTLMVAFNLTTPLISHGMTRLSKNNRNNKASWTEL